MWGCLDIQGDQNIGVPKHTGGIWVSKHMGKSKHMGASKHTGGIQTYGWCPNIWGTSKHTGAIQT